MEEVCWVYARRPFYAMADVEANARRGALGKKPAVIASFAQEMVRRIDARSTFDVRSTARAQRSEKAVRQDRSLPLALDMEP